VPGEITRARQEGAIVNHRPGGFVADKQNGQNAEFVRDNSRYCQSGNAEARQPSPPPQLSRRRRCLARWIPLSVARPTIHYHWSIGIVLHEQRAVSAYVAATTARAYYLLVRRSWVVAACYSAPTHVRGCLQNSNFYCRSESTRSLRVCLGATDGADNRTHY